MSKDESFVKNAGDAKQVKAARSKEEFVEQENMNDVKFVLSTKQGRRFIWKYLSVCGVFEVSYRGNTNDMIFNEGARNVGIRLLNDVTESDQAAYLKMVNESKEGIL